MCIYCYVLPELAVLTVTHPAINTLYLGIKAHIYARVMTLRADGEQSWFIALNSDEPLDSVEIDTTKKSRQASLGVVHSRLLA